jgi:23S rRNA U2552 (ribose-2'-O)-methylase RlmE/FtsJ
MWQEYFPNAIIHGIDINPSCKAHEDNRIKIHIGDQSDDDFLKSLVQTFGNDNLDAVLDDGSHITNHQIKTFDYLYSKLSDDGIYIIEDLRNSYEEFFNHHNVRDVWPGMSYNKREDKLKNYREDFNSWLQMKIKLMDFHSSQTNLVGIHCYPMTIVFENGGINSTST